MSARFPTSSALAALVGRNLPGGCDDCNAHQTVTQTDADLYVLTVHHDETCPWLNGGGPYAA